MGNVAITQLLSVRVFLFFVSTVLHVIDRDCFMVKCDMFYFCVVAKGECVQGPSGRPQQEVKERSSVSAPDAERRLCHPGGGQGRPGGVWRGEFDAPQKHTDTFVQIKWKGGNFTNSNLLLLSFPFFPLIPYPCLAFHLQDLLHTVFQNGKIVKNYTFDEVRDNAKLKESEL